MRNDIKEKLSPITTGWGVWLDSIEITDVKILSDSLSRNLQCMSREDQNYTAKILKLNVDHEITLEKAQHAFNKAIADLETNKTKSFDQSKNEIARLVREFENTKKMSDIEVEKVRVAQN
jgi:flotillin